MTAWPEIERAWRAQWRGLPAEIRLQMHVGVVPGTANLCVRPQRTIPIWQEGSLVLLAIKEEWEEGAGA